MSESPQEDNVSLAAAALADLQRARDEAAEAERRADLEYVANRIVEAVADGLDNRNFSRQWDETQAKDEAKASPNGQATAAKPEYREPSFKQATKLPPAPDRSLLTLSAWLERDIPPRDYLLGGVMCTTSRWLIFGETGIGKTLPWRWPPPLRSRRRS